MIYDVLVTTKNRHDLCLRAVRSALNQTIKPRRIVVVDDASDDPRYQRLASHLPASVVDVVRLETSSREATGSGYAIGYVRNAGLERLSGSDGWLAMLDDDDEWLPNKIAAQAEAASHGAGVIGTNAINRGPAKERLGLHHQWPHGTDVAPGLRDVTNVVRFHNPIINSTAIVRPDVVAAIGRQQPTGFGEDWDWWRRAAAVAPLHFLEAALAFYTKDNGKEYTL